MSLQTGLSVSDLGELHKAAFTSADFPVAHVKNSPEGLTVELYNPAFTREFVSDKKPISGRKLTDIVNMKSEGVIESALDGDQFSSHRRAVSTEDHGECRLRYIPYEIDGVEYGCVLLFTDVQHDLTTTDRTEYLEEFVSVLTHDLRNPVQIAKGWISNIDTESESEQEATTRALRALERIESMVDKTVAISKQRDVTVGTTVLPFRALCEECWQDIETGDSELVFDDEFNLLCDEDMTASLLRNVFMNAVLHNDDPVTVRVGIEDRLATSTRGNSEKEAFYIRDSGQGLSQDEKKRLVEYSKMTSETWEETGLACISNVAAAHNWTIDVRDEYVNGLKLVFSDVSIHGTIPSDQY